MRNVLRYNDRHPANSDNIATERLPVWKVIDPDEMSRNRRTRLSYFLDAEVKSRNLDDCECKPSERGVVVTAAEDMPPLVHKVGEQDGNESFIPQ